MDIKFDELTERIDAEYKEIKKNIKRPNILVTGGTGVGKSSLINLIFGEDIAETGVGKPVTNSTAAYEVPDIPLTLFDTKGYEIGSEKEKSYLTEIIDYAIDNKSDVEKSIHLVWYCIDATSTRLTDFDEKVINKIINNDIPVAVVFTKCDLLSREDLDSMKSIVLKHLSRVMTFEVTTEKKYNFLELNDLIEWSTLKLPEALEVAFVSAQKQNLEVKRKKARKIILQHTAGAGGIGFAPIPFSDGPVLLANQAALFSRVIFVYDMNFLYTRLKEFVAALGLPAILSKAGIWTSGQILKFFPGAGTIVGGFISGSVAASITAGIGFGLSETCYTINKKVISGEINQVESILDQVDEELVNQVKAAVIKESEKFNKKREEE